VQRFPFGFALRGLFRFACSSSRRWQPSRGDPDVRFYSAYHDCATYRDLSDDQLHQL
jgi:hypothetical protein